LTTVFAPLLASLLLIPPALGPHAQPSLRDRARGVFEIEGVVYVDEGESWLRCWGVASRFRKNTKTRDLILTEPTYSAFSSGGDSISRRERMISTSSLVNSPLSSFL